MALRFIDTIYTLTVSALRDLLQEHNYERSLEDVIYTVLGILVALAGTTMILIVGGVYVSKTHFFRYITLSTTQDTHQGYTARTYPDSLVGLQGIAQTPLHPAGKATIHGVCYDVKTLGTYVAPGVAVVVTHVEGMSLTVQVI